MTLKVAVTGLLVSPSVSAAVQVTVVVPIANVAAGQHAYKSSIGVDDGQEPLRLGMIHVDRLQDIADLGLGR